MSDFIKHHGIKGQKWGVRRFQNKDGSLMPAGRKRYGRIDKANMLSIRMDRNISENDRMTATYGMKSKKELKKTAERWSKREAEWNGEEYSKAKAKEQYQKLRKEIADLDKKYPNHNEGKSEKQLKLEEKYMSKGVAPKEAADAARKRLKAEALVAAAGVLAVTGGINLKSDIDAIQNKNFVPLIQKAAISYAVYSAMAPKNDKNKK